MSVQDNTSEKLSQIEKIITELAVLRQKNIDSEGLERRRTETRGERSGEEEFRTAFEKIEQKFYLKDKNSAYLWANESYARGLNIVPEEIVGKTDFDFYPSELAQKYVSEDRRILETGKAEHIEERQILDGRESYIHTIKNPTRDHKGEITGILGTYWDIAEQKQTEEECVIEAVMRINTETGKNLRLNFIFFYNR